MMVTTTRLVAVTLLLAMAACGGEESATPTELATTVPSTTASSTTVSTAASDQDVIEDGVAAFYSGDGDRAAALFELTDRTDDEIRAESAYQAAIGGRLDLRCTQTAPGEFSCSTPYHNAMTEAVGEGGGHDVWPVTVEDGVITKFGFTEHSGLLIDMATFLASEGRFDGFEDCVAGPFPESCAAIELDNLDAWVTWRDTVEPADRVAAVVKSWYGGDCAAAVALSWDAAECSASSVPAQTTAYESALDAQVSVENCATTPAGDHTRLSCDVRYSNAVGRAVGAPPSVTARDFTLMYGLMTAGPDEAPWYEADYPDDSQLRDSFTTFATSSEFADEYIDLGCATTRSPECAALIVDNLDDWSAWHESSG